MASIKSDKEWSGAIRKAVHEYRVSKDDDGRVEKTKKINLLAKALVRLALDKGDVAAMKEIGDRLDGRPNQSLEHKGTLQVVPVVNVTINSDDRPYLAPEAGNGAKVTSH